jgi:hemerythrin-like metal-binding protein
MPFLTWTQSMSVGVGALDAGHRQRMIEIINELHDGIQAGHKKEVLGHVLDELLEYTQGHF